MSASDELQLQQEIRRLVVERDKLNDRRRSFRGGRGGNAARGGGRFPMAAASFGRGGSFGYPTNSMNNMGNSAKWESSGASFDKMDASSPSEIPAKRPREENSAFKSFEGPEFEVEKRPKLALDDVAVDRHRRIMNVGVFGHLLRARDQLQKEETTRQAQLHKTQEQRVEEKLLNGRRNLLELKKRDMEEKRNEENRRLEYVQGQLAAKENELLQMQLVKHFQNMKNFIGTKVHPTIFWIPKVMNKKTEHLQKETVAFIEEKIAGVLRSDFLSIPAPLNANRTSVGAEDAVVGSATEDTVMGEVAKEEGAETLAGAPEDTGVPSPDVIEQHDISVDMKGEDIDSKAPQFAISTGETTTTNSLIIGESRVDSTCTTEDMHLEVSSLEKGCSIEDTPDKTEAEKESDEPEIEARNIQTKKQESQAEAHIVEDKPQAEEKAAATTESKVKADAATEQQVDEPVLKEAVKSVEEQVAKQTQVAEPRVASTHRSRASQKAAAETEVVDESQEKPTRRSRGSEKGAANLKHEEKAAKAEAQTATADVSIEQVEEMTVPMLSAKLKEFGLSTHGKKSVLKERLITYLNSSQ